MLSEVITTCFSLSVRLRRLSRYFFAIWHRHFTYLLLESALVVVRRNLCTILKLWSLRAIRPKCNVMHSEGLTSTGPAAWNFCLCQNARKWTRSSLKRKIKKIWGGAPNDTGFACKTGSWTVKNTIQNAPKLTILRAKIKKFSGEGAQPPPRWGGDTPSPHPPSSAPSALGVPVPFHLRLKHWLLQVRCPYCHPTNSIKQLRATKHLCKTKNR